MIDVKMTQLENTVLNEIVKSLCKIAELDEKIDKIRKKLLRKYTRCAG